jgi:hypothetical protein
MKNVILFLYGLDAGTNSPKSKYLKKNYQNCVVPDLDVSIYKINRKNSFLRIILLNPIMIALLSFTIFVFIFLYKYFNVYISIILPLSILIITLKLTKNYFVSYGVSKALENNICLAEKEIKKHNPKVLIGSSWGGAIAVNLIQRGIWKGHTILLAPAYQQVKKTIMKIEEEQSFQFKSLINYEGKIIVYHCPSDNVIPIEHSHLLCESKQTLNSSSEFYELKVINSDNHKLESLIHGPDYKLKSEIDQLLMLN